VVDEIFRMRTQRRPPGAAGSTFVDTLTRLLSLDALVLGQSWEPIERVHWQRAMVWWVAGRVEVVEVWPDVFVRTAQDLFEVPSVVRFHRARRRDRRVVPFSRDAVWIRDGGACQYCGLGLTRREATWDHVLPKSRGGGASWSNIVVACRPCNQRKGNRTPGEARMMLLKTPQRPSQAALPFLIQRGDAVPPSWKPYLGLP
jgi:5-methylcytosine-specific restriction endonuclease McrA